MPETRTDTTDDRAQQAAALGAEVGKHRGSASAFEDDGTPAHGKHRRPEQDNR
ncbi:hypothetical protein [Streptantibioticus ferralitis]|uniref:Uncharacterized protein n=1 Tax=Streptantibioticus ferralitis TaxID=236510 RepID=A0ABT5Z1B4_9ACTN|nr:hypothetical protein [Streptantibioticus ferralitis]MDF2257631.1 hypothetical protein [Streptantibioticus ferralitis]